MKKLLAFFTNLDARAWRTVWVSLALLLGVAALIVLGKSGVVGVSEQVTTWFGELRDGPWALPATVLIFVVTAYIAAPQFMLIAACVVAFGPWLGFWYSMAGTVISGVTMFYTGRWAGAAFLRRYGGSTVNRMSRFIGRNDFLASLIVRNVPTAPAIVVNMAFGASHANFWRYIAGLTIGSIPKTAIVALLGQSMKSAMGGAMLIAGGVVVAVAVIWVVVTLVARKAVRGDRPDGDDPVEAEPAPTEAGASGS
ncbi:MAG: VTT domain-containing protein [Alphaproteobacteria bacterium]